MRSRLMSLVALAVVATALLVTSADCALACSCAPGTQSEPEWLRDVKDGKVTGRVVFTGTVTEVLHPPEDSGPEAAERVTFAVESVVAGKPGATAVVETSSSDSTCGYTFQLGSRYLVDSASSENGLSTGLCTYTREMRAGEVLVFAAPATSTTTSTTAAPPTTAAAVTTTTRPNSTAATPVPASPHFSG